MANEVARNEGKRVLVTDYSKGIFGTSDNFIMAGQMARALAGSTIVPEAYRKNEGNCLIAIEQAQRLNISPLMVMQNLYVVKGNPAWSGKFLIAMINQSGKYETSLKFDEKQDKDGRPWSCTAWAVEDGQRVEGIEVTMKMAEDYGWTGNNAHWRNMPQLMLRYRAASNFSRLNCPEVTLGIYTQEELADSGPEEGLEAVVERAALEAREMTAAVVVETPEAPREEGQAAPATAEPF